LGKAIHYTFFPSQSDQTADPLVLWFSGSPGCSSIMGSFYENGPIIFVPEQINLVVNPNSWNKKANLLYLEMPQNVGFSTGKE
jgi:carboxypeptidase C (cathepsin A)